MPFDFNFYSSLLLIPFVQGIIYCLLLLLRGIRTQQISNFFLALILLLNSITIAFWMLGYAGWYDLRNAYTSFMFYFPFNNFLLLGPAVYFYFRSLSNATFTWRDIEKKHFIAPVLWLIFIAGKALADYLLFYPFPDTEAYQYGTRGLYAELDKSDAAYFISLIFFFIYTGVTFRDYCNYQHYIHSNFSSLESIEFRWLKNLLYAILAGGIIFALFFLVSLICGGLSFSQHWYSYLLLGILVFYTSINGYSTAPPAQLRFVASADVAEPARPAESMAGEDQKAQLLAHILEFRLHLNPELTLNDLARSYSTNSSYLSRLINQGFNQNFNDFINGLRIREFETSVRSGLHKKQTLLSIAYDCGFNSKSTFNRAFKKEHGVTPVQFLKAQNQ